MNENGFLCILFSNIYIVNAYRHYIYYLLKLNSYLVLVLQVIILQVIIYLVLTTTLHGDLFLVLMIVGSAFSDELLRKQL